MAKHSGFEIKGLEEMPKRLEEEGEKIVEKAYRVAAEKGVRQQLEPYRCEHGEVPELRDVNVDPDSGQIRAQVEPHCEAQQERLAEDGLVSF